MELEKIMQIIINSGDARSIAFKALESAKKGCFEEAQEHLQKAKEKSLQAHKVQTTMLGKEASGARTSVDLIMVHAQDHLMTAMLARELIGELVNVYKRLDGCK